MPATTRREVIRRGLALVGPLVTAANSLVGDGGFRPRSVREYPRSTMLAVSPDGRQMCLEDWSVSGRPIRVVELAEGRTLFTGRFKSRVLQASYVPGGRALSLRFPGWRDEVPPTETVIDLQAGTRLERRRPVVDLRAEISQDITVSDDLLLFAHYQRSTGRMDSLSLLEFPNYRVRKRVEFGAEAVHAAPDPFLWIRGDCGAFVCVVGNVLEYRRTRDLELLWRRPIPVGQNVARAYLAAGGGTVAAAIRGTRSEAIDSSARVLVLDAASGERLTELPLDGSRGLVVSPDDRWLAITAAERAEKGALAAFVNIYDVRSGLKLATLEHGRTPRGSRQFLLSGCSVECTSDGKYVVTSGISTKVWKLDGE
jgi:hypothetical protein